MINFTKEHETYPYLFTCMPEVERPEHIYATGNSSLLSSHCISIIGSRNTTRAGEQTAFNIAARFASEGYTIVSGMAPGIDSAAHKGALSVGGNTIAILASSLKIQDIRNISLAEQIIKGKGLLISEYTEGVGTGPRYIARDRLIAALGLICIPVQCEGSRSGTMATVRRAAKYHREIWVPNPLVSEASAPQYIGIWELLRQGGPILADRIITSKADYPHLLEELATLASSTPRWQQFFNFN